VVRPGIHLGVWHREKEKGLYVWGTTRTIPVSCFVLEVLNPGMLVAKHRRGEEAGKFVNVAVLEGNTIKVLNREAAMVLDCPPVVTALLGFETPATPDEPVNVLVELAVSMRAHGRGGTLLVVPSHSREWQESIVRPLSHPISPPFAELAFLMGATPEERRERWWHDALRRAVDAVAGLTAVDGATIVNDENEVLAFGAKIARRQGRPQVEQVTVTEPVAGVKPAVISPSQLGGMRHMSGAQFVQDQRNALSLVASQDGRFTIFAWSPCSEMVHAHRVETLLV
jgi:hypothetical protein